jgi:hypothetical protein
VRAPNLTWDESADRKIIVAEGNWVTDKDTEFIPREDVAKIMLEISESQPGEQGPYYRKCVCVGV